MNAICLPDSESYLRKLEPRRVTVVTAPKDNNYDTPTTGLQKMWRWERVRSEFRVPKERSASKSSLMVHVINQF